MKTELVLKGGTRLAFALWKGGGPTARRNCSLVACNLAVGKVRALSITVCLTPVLCRAPDRIPPPINRPVVTALYAHLSLSGVYLQPVLGAASNRIPPLLGRTAVTTCMDSFCLGSKPANVNAITALKKLVSPTQAKVNTATMVRHGAGQLLVELVAKTGRQKDADVRKRASAAFRNLLCVSVSNETLLRARPYTRLSQFSESSL